MLNPSTEEQRMIPIPVLCPTNLKTGPIDRSRWIDIVFKKSHPKIPSRYRFREKTFFSKKMFFCGERLILLFKFYMNSITSLSLVNCPGEPSEDLHRWVWTRICCRSSGRSRTYFVVDDNQISTKNSLFEWLYHACTTSRDYFWIE